MRTHTRGARAKFRAALVAMAAVGALLAPLIPAAAWDDAPPPPMSGGGSDGGSGSGEYRCGANVGGNATTLYKKVGGAWVPWHALFPNCLGGTQWTWYEAGQARLVTTGFLVYRFYGTVANPVTAMSRAQAVTTSWDQWDRGFTFPAMTPQDAGLSVGSPWVAQAGTNHNELATTGSYDGATWVTDDAGRLVPATPHLVAGSCTTVMSGNTVREWYEAPETTAAEKIQIQAVLGTAYWKTSDRGAAPATGAAEAGIRNPTGYPFKWATWVSGDTTSAPVRAGADADAFFLTSITWEERPCASPFQFVNSNTAPASEKIVVGTCYIPYTRKAEGIRTSTGVSAWKWPEIGRGDGERFSVRYQGTPYTPSGPGGDSLDRTVTGLSATEQSALVTAWRRAMVADYRQWFSQSGGYQSGPARSQFVPANAYKADRLNDGYWLLRQPNDNNVDQAAADLFNAARCRVATTVTMDATVSDPPQDVAASLTLNVKNTEIYQVSPTAATITVTPGPLTCSTGPCTTDQATLATLAWDASVSVAGSGFTMREVSDVTKPIPSGVDGVYSISKSHRAGLQTGQRIDMRFVRATDAQRVKVTLHNITATYTQPVTSGGLTVHGVIPSSQQTYVIETGGLTSSAERPVTVTAQGSPVGLTRAGATYTFALPVMGAVNQPSQR